MNPRRLIPSMSWLVAFEAAAKHLSFTRAAKELSLTQSVVSRHVLHLEELLEVQLFRREGRQLELTEAGEMYLGEVRGGLQRIRNASLQVNTYRTTSGSVHLASLPTFAAKWLMPRLDDFYANNPDIQVHIHSRIGQFDLESAGIDAAIGVGGGVWPGAVSYFLLEDQLVPIISPSLMQKCSFNHPGDTANHTLLQVKTRPDDWNQWFSIYGISPINIRPGPQFEVTSHLIQAVVAGLGIALVPRDLIEEEINNGSLVIPFSASSDTSFSLSYYLYVPPHQYLPSSVATLKDWILGAASSQV